jgi:hypothetical protein
MQSGDARALGGGVPDRPEAGPPQGCSLRADEDEAPIPRRCESVQMPAQPWRELGREGDSPAAGLRLLMRSFACSVRT